jgi:phosphoglycolate phosphatase-like HAD superfamily hydrolase
MMPSRLVLFDVDGTLLSSGPRGKRIFASALEEVYGTSGDIDGFRFEGKLDPIIVTELMAAAGVPESDIAGKMRHALALYLDRLEETFRAQGPPTLKPGIVPLLDALEKETAVVRALLTGNVERGARIKLTAAGLWHRFAFGTWGDEGSCRDDLGPIALARAAEVTGRRFRPEECVVVGDSRHDVACGLALGARVVAVATGLTSAEDLERAGAHVVFSDFSDFAAAREAIVA